MRWAASHRDAVNKIMDNTKNDSSRMIFDDFPNGIAELITARPVEGANGVLGGDYRNLEIASLMEMARLHDEDEAVTLLMLH